MAISAHCLIIIGHFAFSYVQGSVDSHKYGKPLLIKSCSFQRTAMHSFGCSSVHICPGKKKVKRLKNDRQERDRQQGRREERRRI